MAPACSVFCLPGEACSPASLSPNTALDAVPKTTAVAPQRPISKRSHSAFGDTTGQKVTILQTAAHVAPVAWSSGWACRVSGKKGLKPALVPPPHTSPGDIQQSAGDFPPKPRDTGTRAPDATGARWAPDARGCEHGRTTIRSQEAAGTVPTSPAGPVFSAGVLASSRLSGGRRPTLAHPQTIIAGPPPRPEVKGVARGSSRVEISRCSCPRGSPSGHPPVVKEPRTELPGHWSQRWKTHRPKEPLCWCSWKRGPQAQLPLLPSCQGQDWRGAECCLGNRCLCLAAILSLPNARGEVARVTLKGHGFHAPQCSAWAGVVIPGCAAESGAVSRLLKNSTHHCSLSLRCLVGFCPPSRRQLTRRKKLFPCWTSPLDSGRCGPKRGQITSLLSQPTGPPAP
uniref:uncharacterized protein LOC120888926 n=1 Tax=Ictidomys tridecemlineatus TaxID=43179 RepID=UPI001A9EF287|nr:uncharacterized protein LOC120888926 [Ictidomys tridecemlineatus]